MTKLGRPALFALAVVGALLQPAVARAEWKILGARQVDRKGDRNEIAVTAARGGFKAIKLAVKGAAVEFQDVHVIYGNGEPDKLEYPEELPVGLGEPERLVRHDVGCDVHRRLSGDLQGVLDKAFLTHVGAESVGSRQPPELTDARGDSSQLLFDEVSVRSRIPG